MSDNLRCGALLVCAFGGRRTLMKHRLLFAVAIGAIGAGMFGCASSAELVLPSGQDASAGSSGVGTGGNGGTASTGSAGTGVINLGDASIQPPDDGGPTCGDACTAPDAGPSCGNSLVETGETCDDGNSKPGDGCSGICRLEPNYNCPTPGQACVSTIVCGDSMITGNEACDDGNKVANDGCSDTCQVETGYACSAAGEACIPGTEPKWGDGKVNTNEGRDDRRTLDG